MPDEPSADPAAELARLREDVTALRRDVRHLLDLLGERGWQKRPERRYLESIEAECLAARCSPFWVPMIQKAHEDYAEMVLFDRQNRCRAQFGVNDKGAWFHLINAEGKVIIGLNEAADGSGQLHVAAPDGTPRAGMRVNDVGGVVNVVNEHGKPLAFLLGSPEGGEVFAVSAQQKAGVTIRATMTGGMVTVNEPGGDVMGFLTASADMGSMTVYGPHREMAVSIGGSEEGGGVVFYDVDGESIGVLP